jgi:hypothetical protein
MTNFRRLLVGTTTVLTTTVLTTTVLTTTVLALAGLSATGAAASATASTTAPRGVPVRVLHMRVGTREATFTIRGDWKMSHAKLPREHMPRPKLIKRATKHVDATASSGNWSGYVDEAKTGTTFKSVTAYFNIPNLNCANSQPGPDGSWYSDWVGLDGWSNGTVEQEGTEAYCSSGAEGLYVFYEMYPASPVVFTGAAPGDALQTTTTYNATAGTYSLKVADLTQSGAGVTETIRCAATCANDSAEVISEAPGGGPPNYGLADFGAANYTNTEVVTASGTTGGFASNSADWTSAKINMVANGTGETLATAGVLSGTNAFMVRWVRAL